jgi:hypothetical protein
MPRLHLAAELVSHHLLAVADAEDRHAAVEQPLRRARAALVGTPAGDPDRMMPLGCIRSNASPRS